MNSALKFFAATICVILSACSGGNKNNSAAVPVLQNSKDTFIVSGKSITFFHPSENEINEMMKTEGEESGLNEVSEDFLYYANAVIDSLKISAIKAALTDSKIISVRLSNGNVVNISRQSGEGIIGVIFSDAAKEPRVEYGVFTDLDYWQMMEEYFSASAADTVRDLKKK